jgi:hypothetical protein
VGGGVGRGGKRREVGTRVGGREGVEEGREDVGCDGGVGGEGREKRRWRRDGGTEEKRRDGRKREEACVFT